MDHRPYDQALSGKAGVIFDVDGTLYHAALLRRRMFKELAAFYLTHVTRWRELYGLYLFRRIREQPSYRALSLEDHVREAARRAGVPFEAMQAAVGAWMFSEPLKHLGAFRNERCAELWHEAESRGMRVFVYSDYPADEKLEALGLHAEQVFYPSADTFCELKPSREAMAYILDAVALEAEDMVFVGDRDSKDGESARLAGMEYLDVKDLP